MSDEADRVGPTDPEPEPEPTPAADPTEQSVTDEPSPADGENRELDAGRAVLLAGDTTVIARTVARTVAPVVLLTAIALTLRGHNLPGGGFIGGVLTAIAFVLLYVVFSLEYVQENLVSAPGSADPTRTLFAAGLALALGAGLAPIVVSALVPGDYGFLTQGYLILPHPLPGPFFQEFEVATALAFDLGVYLVVVGGLLTIAKEVGEE